MNLKNLKFPKLHFVQNHLLNLLYQKNLRYLLYLRYH
jgi:hypothetical protein